MLGPITWDYAELTMEFGQNGRRVKLAASMERKNKLITGDKEQLMKGNIQTCGIQVAPWHLATQCYELHLEEEAAISTEAHKLLEEYPELMYEPIGLPPARPGFDHIIPLQEGSNPDSIRPYKYPAMQKTIIEELVEEMLQKGLIQTSSSPFASPVVLVKKKDGVGGYA